MISPPPFAWLISATSTSPRRTASGGAEDWFNKRLSAWLNLRLLGRGFRFRCTARGPRPLCAPTCASAATTGSSSPATPPPWVSARKWTGRPSCWRRRPGQPARPGRARQPRLLHPVHHGGRLFRALLRPLAARRAHRRRNYPFAQRVGPVWLVAVNSAVANRWPWDARGAVGAAQLERLEELLETPGRRPRASW